MLDINRVIGKNLLKLRKNKKLTQLELAEKFNYSDKTISKWEAGESLPSVEILYNLATFYNVSLDDLTKEDFEIPSQTKPRIRDRFLPAKLVITLLAVSVIWLVATIIFVTLQLIMNYYYGLVFLWAVPLSCVVLIVFNAIWGRGLWLFPILTVFLWSTIAGIYAQLFKYNIWQIFILGIPIQVAIILWSALITKPKNKPKKEKASKPAKAKPAKESKQQTKEQIVPIQTSAPTEEDETNTPPADLHDDDFGFDYIKNKKDT